MPATYEPIATTTLGSTGTSVTFSSIPSTYTDLVLIVEQTASSTNNHGIRFNNDTNYNYSTTLMYGSSSTTASEQKSTSGGGAQNFIFTCNGATSGRVVNVIHIMNYSNSTTYKTAFARWANGANASSAHVGLWQNTATINRIDYVVAAGNINSGSTFTLYGIKAA